MSPRNAERRPGEGTASEKAWRPGINGSATFRLNHDVTMLDVPGVGRVGAVLPVVPEDAPPAVRDGIARRRLVVLDGACPCGARRSLPNREQRRRMRLDRARAAAALWELTVLHAEDCPATDEALEAAGVIW